MTTTFDLQKHALSVYARRGEAVIVPSRTVHGSNWSPAERECHDNVERWTEENPQHAPVGGWLLSDYEGLRPFVTLHAHSVVRCEDGSLMDITPSRTLAAYPFIEADLPYREFREIVVALNISRINLRI